MLIFLLLAILFLITGAWYVITSPVLTVKRITQEIPAERESLYGHVDFLCNISPPRNSRNIESLNKAAEYIFQAFKKLDCRVSYQEYPVGNEIYKNVVASFGPEDGKRLVVGAHYDVCGDQPGADDNASGVAGLLEVARLVDKLKPTLKYRIDFVAYSLEEPPYFRTVSMGSYVHAKSLKEESVNVLAMVCLEMIGYYSDEPKSQEFPVGIMKTMYPDQANFIAVVGKTGQGNLVKKVKKSMKRICSTEVCSLVGPASISGVDFSDHRNYWNMEMEAVMITNTSFYRNKNYHEKTDAIGTLNFEKMTDVVKGIYLAVTELASEK